VAHLSSQRAVEVTSLAPSLSQLTDRCNTSLGWGAYSLLQSQQHLKTPVSCRWTLAGRIQQIHPHTTTHLHTWQHTIQANQGTTLAFSWRDQGETTTNLKCGRLAYWPIFKPGTTPNIGSLLYCMYSQLHIACVIHHAHSPYHQHVAYYTECH